MDVQFKGSLDINVEVHKKKGASQTYDTPSSSDQLITILFGMLW